MLESIGTEIEKNKHSLTNLFGYGILLTGEIIMDNKYLNMVEEWCEILESKAFARQHGKWSKEQPTTFFYFKINKKYTKIIRVSGGQESVHAFIDNKTLDIYKAANWAAPAKGVRYHFWDDFNELLDRCDPNGAYLYKRGKISV